LTGAARQHDARDRARNRLAHSRCRPPYSATLIRPAASHFHWNVIRAGLIDAGHIYKPNGGDILDILGFIGDLGAGGMYIATLAMNGGQGAIAFAIADYGTKFMIVAGLLNFIAVADAYHIAIGKKQ